ncbi:MAG TPA: penicillin-binding protein [Myxococcota bacterium]|jgi:cell division protein FtsI (penicillin-binding protein 3)
MRSPDVRVAARRVAIARSVLLLLFGVLCARAAHLAVDERGARRGQVQTVNVVTLPAERGAVFDRDGTPLALSIDAPSVYAVAGELRDLPATARKLAGALGLGAAAVEQRLRKARSFTYVARWVDPEAAQRVRALTLPGVGVLDEPRRVYPHKELAAQVIGFANIDGVGVRAIEQQEEDWLRGEARRVGVERDARGGLLVSGGLEGWSTAGGDVRLTLDMALQAEAAAGLRDAVAATGARGGVVLSLDPFSGEVLALAEAPAFDPNRFRTLEFPRTRAHAFLDAQEPGSTLKAFLVAAALEKGAIREDTVFDCEEGSLRVPGKTIRDLHPHGAMRPADILRVSSNIGAVKIAWALERDPYFEMLRRFGFGERTGSGFPDESAGMLRAASRWRAVDHATVAFGQGLSVTPIQLAVATAVLANGGLRIEPRLVAARRPARGAWQPVPPSRGERVISRETARSVLGMLEGVVGPEGTGGRAALQGVRVAGKTGSAQKLDASLGQYATDRFTAWFIGVVPADAPRLVIVVALDEPRRPNHLGGTAAAPLFARVAAAQLARFGLATQPVLPPFGAPLVQVAAAEAPAARPHPARVAPPPVAAPPPARRAIEVARVEDRVLLPDFRGFTVAEVQQIAATSQLDVSISGSGRAIAQEPPPGTVLAIGGAPVRVRFEPRAPGDGRES